MFRENRNNYTQSLAQMLIDIIDSDCSKDINFSREFKIIGLAPNVINPFYSHIATTGWY